MGGSDPRSEDTSEAGLWRLDRPQTGVAPTLFALFMTRGPYFGEPQLLVEVVSRLWFPTTIGERSPDRIPDQTNDGNGPLIRHVFISC